MNCFVTEGGGWGGGKSHTLALQLVAVHPIWTKIGLDMVFDSKNKPMEEFLIFLKVQDGRRCSKLNFDNVFTQKSHFG